MVSRLCIGAPPVKAARLLRTEEVLHRAGLLQHCHAFHSAELMLAVDWWTMNKSELQELGKLSYYPIIRMNREP